MRKVYYDITGENNCISLFVMGAEAVPAGVEICSMSVRDKNAEYKRIEEQLDIRFIFDDDIPNVDFYTAPRIDIFAVTSEGGFLGTVGGPPDVETIVPICYINSKKECFKAADSLKELLGCPEWRESMKLNEDVLIFDSVEEAKENLEFIEYRGLYEK